MKITLKYSTFTLLPALAQYREGLLIKSPTAYEPDIEAARDYMKGYVFMRGFKKRFETVWLDK